MNVRRRETPSEIRRRHLQRKAYYARKNWRAFDRNRAYRSIKEKNPEKAKKLLEIAEIYIEMSMSRDAYDVLLDAHSFDEKNGRILELLIKLSLEDNRDYRAQRWAEKLHSIKEWKIIAELELGVIYAKQFLDAARSHPPYYWNRPASQRHSLANAKVNSKQYLENVLKSKKIKDPNLLSSIYCYLAQIAKFTGNEDEELQNLKTALKHDPNNQRTLQYLGEYYGNHYRITNNSKKAKEFFEKAIKSGPDESGTLHVHLAIALDELDQPLKSLKLIEKILKMDIDEKEKIRAIRLKSEIFGSQDNLEQAIDTLNDGLLIDQHNIACLMLKSDYQGELEDWNSVYETNRLIQKIALSKNDIDLLITATRNISISLSERNRKKDALKVLSEYNQIKFNQDILLRKISLLNSMGKYSQSLTIANKSISEFKKSDNSFFINAKIVTLFSMNENKKAITLLTKEFSKKGKFTFDQKFFMLRDLSIHTKHKTITKMLEKSSKSILKAHDPHHNIFTRDAERAINWINALENNEKAYKELFKKIEKKHLADIKSGRKNFRKRRDESFSTFLYNDACAFAISKNKKMAEQLLKKADKLHPSKNWPKIAETDDDFLNIKK